MIRWLMSLPKTMFVAIVLGAGILFIVISDPPRTVCDSQVENFLTTTSDFLQQNQSNKVDPVPRFRRLLDECKTTGSSGGCLNLFTGVRRVLAAETSLSPECLTNLGKEDLFATTVWQTLDVMVRLAWGAKPPMTATMKQGFLDAADLNLFCSLKKTATDIYGDEAFKGFIEPYFTALPEANTLQRNDAWSKMLFSVSCQAYL